MRTVMTAVIAIHTADQIRMPTVYLFAVCPLQQYRNTLGLFHTFFIKDMFYCRIQGHNRYFPFYLLQYFYIFFHNCLPLYSLVIDIRFPDILFQIFQIHRHFCIFAKKLFIKYLFFQMFWISLTEHF